MSVLNALILSRRPAVAFAGLGIFWGMFAAHVPVFKAQLEVSDAVFGFLLLGSAVGLVSSMWVAPRADKRLGARGMQVGILALALAGMLPVQMSVPILFALGMAGVGLASGLTDVVMNARVGELEAQHNRPLMNANHGAFSLAYAVGALIAGATREAGVPPVLVFGGFVLVSLCILPFMRLAPATVPDGGASGGKYPFGPIVICGAIVLVAFMTEAMVESWSALHIERTLDGGAAEGAFGPAMLGLTMAIGRFSGQALAERFETLWVIISAAVFASCGAMLAATAPSPQIAYIGFGIFGLGVSVIGPLGLALVGPLVAPHLRTEAISRVAVIGFSGFFFAPTLMGLSAEFFGLRVAFGGVSAIILCAIPLAIWANGLSVADDRKKQ